MVRGEDRVSADDLLREARTGLTRVTPAQAAEQLDRGAILIDIRSDSQRDRDGVIPGAAFVPRNVLEWRLDPFSAHRIEELACRDGRVILICDEGFQSSLAAATLQRMGLDAGDVIGGFQAWMSAGLPVSGPGAA